MGTCVSRPPRILALCPEPTMRAELARHIEEGGFQVLSFADPDRALATLARKEVEVVLCDADLGAAGAAVDWLIRARELETEAAFAVLVDGPNDLPRAAEAINRAGAAKILLTPWERDDLLDELGEAVAMVRRDTHRSRRFALITARQARIHRDRDRLRQDLARTLRRVGELEDQLEFLELSRVERIVEPSGDAEHVVGLLLQVLRGCVPALVTECEHIAQTAMASAQALGWSRAECMDLRHAALLHHILLPAHPSEDRAILTGARCEHATAAGELLVRLPGLSTVADIVARHHDANSDPDDLMRPPRTARLLHVISAFSCAMRKQEQAAPGEGPAGAQALALATNALLDAGDSVFDPELLHPFLTEHVPSLFGRDEHHLPLDALEPGMELARPILSGQLSLLSVGTTLNDPQIARLREMSAQHPIHGAWIRGHPNQAQGATTLAAHGAG